MRLIGLTASVIVFAGLVIAGTASAVSVTFNAFWPNQAYFCEPSGLALDASGNIYVADTKNHRIVKLDPYGNVAAIWGQKGSGLNDFYYPYGITMAPNGYLYVCDTGNCRIKKMTTSGSVVHLWGSRGTGNTQFDWPLGICADPSSNIYVADSGQFRGDTGWGNCIKKFDANGNFLAKWGAFSEQALPNGYAVPSSITYWPAQNQVFITDTMHNRVCVTTNTGTWVNSYTGPSDLPLSYPRGICYSGSNQFFYVADTNHDRVRKMMANMGRVWDKGSGQSSKEGEFYFPRAVAVDSAGNCYVADTFNHRIQKLNGSDGSFMARYGGRGTSDGAFDRPHSVATDSAGNVYVADTYSSRIQKFDPNGTFLGWIGKGNLTTGWHAPGSGEQPSSGSGDGQMKWPQGVYVHGNGDIYVANTENNRVEKFNSTGAFVAQIGDGKLNAPCGVALNSAGYIYVADTKNHRVVKFDPSGTLLETIGKFGHKPGEFEDPTDVGIDANGNIYVCDSGNHRVQKFSPSGNLLWCRGGFGTGNGQFNKPRGIGVQPDGSVYVADTENQRVQLLGADGSFITKWGTWGSDANQFRQPCDVATGPNGALYVIERSNYRISKFTVTP